MTAAARAVATGSVADRHVVSTSGKDLFEAPLCHDCARRWTDSLDCAEHFS
jgi:hypothetical protein